MNNFPYCSHPTILDPKPLPKPFTLAGGYAAVECGKGLMVIFNNQQLKYCTTENSALNYIKKHKKGKSLAELPI